MTEKVNNQNTEFEKDQLDEIELGKKAGLDTLLYEDNRYLAIQMRQIRLGLMEKLPVEQYADPEYDWFQMEEIRKGLREGLAITTYADKEIPYEKMRQIRMGLKHGIDLSHYRDVRADVLKQIWIAHTEGIDLSKYIEERYDAKQLAEIRQAKKDGLDMEPYLIREFIGPSLAEIRKGLLSGVDVSVYAKPDYSWRQMRELRLGMEGRISVQKYNNPLYSWRQMREIRVGMEIGLDVDSYAGLRFTSREMHKKRTALLEAISGDKQKLTRNMVRAEGIEVEISSNSMEAFVRVMEKEKTVSRERLMEILEVYDIRAGILESAIEDIINGKNTRKNILVARGQIPRKGADGWYECYFRTLINKRPKIMKDGSADYKNVEWFECVKAGQKLAYYHRAEPGTDGYTVSGKPIPALRGMEKGILVGKGFEMQEDKKTYIATINGMVKMNDTTLEVTRHLEVEDVTLATGNINFDGSLHIKGNVENGTEIRVTEDLEIDGNVGAATIICGGNVLLKKGMNSAGHGYIRSEQGIVSRFFESAKVEAKGDIQVNKCLNSQLYAGGMIISSSMIVGGVACAEKGFRITNAGNSIGLHTALKIGFSEEILQEMRELNGAVLEAGQELQMLQNSYRGMVAKYSPEVRNGMELFIKLEKSIASKRTEIEEQKEKLERYQTKLKDGKIVIGGRAYEGTVVEIDGRRWQAANQFNVVIKTDSDEIIVSNN